MKIPHPHLALSQLQHEVLTGLMLGDGHLCVQHLNAALMVGRASKDKDYSQYEADIFGNLLSPAYHQGVKLYSKIDKSTGKTYDTYNWQTIANPSLTEYHNIWYQNKEKIIPASLVLTPTTVAHWLADDGHITFNKLPYRFQIDLATHSFTEDENHFLANLLYERYREKFKVSPSKGKYFFIRCYDSACRAIFADIDGVFKMTRKRLWDKPESRFYMDPPERQVSRIETTARFALVVEKAIKQGQPITMKELAEKMGCIYTGKVDYKTINKLLKPYLDTGKISKEVDKFNNNTTTIKVIS